MNFRSVISCLLVLLTAVPCLAAGSAEGDWVGTLDVGGQKLRLVLHVVQQDDGSLVSTLDSPDQGAEGIPTGSTRVEDGTIAVEVPGVGGRYEGTFSDDGESIEGKWSQGGQSFALRMERTDEPIEKIVRPQDPTEPLPYAAEDVRFDNPDAGIRLAGTLTLPKGPGPFPAAVLVSGSGPQNRDEELMNHRPFLVLADHLTREGIAVLRFDDRGVGESEGDFAIATSADFATDALAAVRFLRGRKEIAKERIGIAGHSEGGLIAPMVAAESDEVAFIVLMAGPGLTGEEILYLQGELIARADGTDEKLIKKSRKSQRKIFSMIKRHEGDDLESELRAYIEKQIAELDEEELAQVVPEGQEVESVVDQQIAQLTTPWFRYFLTHDPVPYLKRVRQPVLAINGEKDLQVPPRENLEAIEAALNKGGNDKFEIVEMPGLNHLFQESDSGAPSEYGEIEQTWSPDAMGRIADWINKVAG